MKPITIIRAIGMSLAGIGIFLSMPCSLSASNNSAASANGGSSDGRFELARAFDKAPIFVAVPNASALAPSNAGQARRSDDTESPQLFAPDLDRALRQFQSHRISSTQSDTGFEPPLQINVVFHVIIGPSSEGDLSESRLIDQIAVLNDAYRSAGLHFNIGEIRRYPDSPYYAGGCFPTTTQGMQMKANLAVNPATTVNVYTCKLLFPLIVGYGTFPNEYPEGDHQHGVIIDYDSVTGGAAPLDLGNTLVHELGHYFGLFHTFEGGCTEPGDGVSDTPAEASPAYGCPIGRDSCTQAGVDPVSNFMDYSNDACMDNFTLLQNARMHALILTYRPSLAESTFTIGSGMTGNWYDPSESGHGFIVEILPGNQMLAAWFVFAPDGGPAWIMGTGPISGNKAVLQGYQVVGAGGRFPPNFSPAQIQRQPWGTLTFSFDDCNHGQVSWQSVVAGYTSGSMPIVRLTMPAGLSCS